MLVVSQNKHTKQKCSACRKYELMQQQSLFSKKTNRSKPSIKITSNAPKVSELEHKYSTIQTE